MTLINVSTCGRLSSQFGRPRPTFVKIACYEFHVASTNSSSYKRRKLPRQRGAFALPTARQSEIHPENRPSDRHRPIRYASGQPNIIKIIKIAAISPRFFRLASREAPILRYDVLSCNRAAPRRYFITVAFFKTVQGCNRGGNLFCRHLVIIIIMILQNRSVADAPPNHSAHCDRWRAEPW